MAANRSSYVASCGCSPHALSRPSPAGDAAEGLDCGVARVCTAFACLAYVTMQVSRCASMRQQSAPALVKLPMKLILTASCTVADMKRRVSRTHAKAALHHNKTNFPHFGLLKCSMVSLSTTAPACSALLSDAKSMRCWRRSDEWRVS
jgi:hypothetical protein